MTGYSLTLYQSWPDTGTAIGARATVGNLTKPLNDWRRSIRARGGFWLGSGMLTEGEAGITEADLVKAFYRWLGGDLVERSGGRVTWDGLIYDLELEINGIRRRRSLDDLYNAVATTYETEGEVYTSSYATVDQSIARYGRREELLTADNTPAATASAYRDTYLSRSAWPWARPVGVAKPDRSKLTVRACGYVFTANWLFAKQADDTTKNVSTWLSEIVGTAEGLSSDHGGSVSGAGDCQFLSGGTIETNTLQRVATLDTEQRTWDLISDLAELGDSSGNPWAAWVDASRRLNYGALDLSVRYYLRGGELFDLLAGPRAINPWQVRPGVVRDLSFVMGHAEYGSMLADARDLWVEEVEASADGRISLKPGMLEDLILAPAG